MGTKKRILFLTLSLAIFAVAVYFGGAAGCSNDDAAAATAPTVSSTDPTNVATGVAINWKVAATFSTEMNPATLTTSTFLVTGPGSTPVVGTVTYATGGDIAIFTPTGGLASNTTFTATITAGATNLAGTALAQDYVWTFTTGASADTVAPTISSTDPINAATAVPINWKIAVAFSEELDPLTVTTDTFLVTGPGTTPVAGTVEYALVGSVATFTPESDLTASTTYTATITVATTDLAGNALATAYSWTFTTSTAADTTPPTVSSTNPANVATGVSLNSKIAASFSEGMNPLTITTANFLVTGPGTTPVTGTVAYTLVGNVATFTPTSYLTANTTYTATITTGVEDLAGNAKASNFIWTFTTGTTADTTAPTVTSMNPADAAVDVGINRTIAAVFSEEMDPLTVTTLTVLVTGPGTTAVTGTVGYALAGNTVTFTPASNLTASTLYTVTITTGAVDLAGNALVANKVWTFTTGTTADTTAPTVLSTTPTNTETSVPLNKTIVANFSEDMNSTTITTGSFIITAPDTTQVVGAVAYDLVNNFTTFTPSSNLLPSSVYTATVTTAVKDLAGNAMAANNVWTFTTGTTTAQSVSQAVVPLGSSSNFAILASAAITNIPTSAITGDVGLTPDTGANITGFSLSGFVCTELQGLSKMYAVDAAGPACIPVGQQDPTLLTNAKTAALDAFTDARNAARGTPQAISGDLNGLTFYPGLYESGTSLEISPGGFLYLDAQGDSNAVFVIRSATSITTGATSEVVLTKGAKATNVFWTAGSAITIGTNSIMKGTLIAGTAITLQTGANLEGRALNQGAAAAAITLDQATITVPTP